YRAWPLPTHATDVDPHPPPSVHNRPPRRLETAGALPERSLRDRCLREIRSRGDRDNTILLNPDALRVVETTERRFLISNASKLVASREHCCGLPSPHKSEKRRRQLRRRFGRLH